MNSSYSIASETLTLLEWTRIGQHLATFTATKLGLVSARQLLIPTQIEQSQSLLNQTKEIDILEQQLGASLSFEGICDIHQPLQRAKVQGVLNGRELYDVATTLAGVRRIRRSIDSSENIPTLQELVINVRTYPELEQEIYHCIDDHGDVTDRASEKLRLIRIELKTTRDRIQKLLQNILQRHSNAIHQPVITQRGDRFVIQVKVTHKETIPGVVHDVSASGSTLYIEPHAIVSLGNQLRQFQRQEQREVEIICRELSAKVAAVGEDLEILLVVATAIDLATARYRYSTWLGANPPRLITTRQQITLRQLRHPLLVWQQQHEQGGNVVPTDLVIQPHTQVVTITGPNTGGKTVTLKTLAIAALMAKVGLYVTAKEPVEIPWFDQVLADIGDEQSLQQSLSTFSSHIRRIGHILAEISPNSLVLLDEVGAGTDPAEGSALARALLQYLADRAYLTIATTHYGELKALKYEDQRFENASVEFDDVSLSPTYRLLWGIPGRSNALSIARRLGLNEEVIVAAENQVGLAGGGEVNEIIAGLEAQRRLQEEKAQAAAELLQQAEAFYLEVSQKAAELQAREQQLKIAQDQSIQAEIDAAKAKIAQTIRQLQQGTPTGQDAQQATIELNRIIQERATPPPPPPVGYQPKVGERIRIPRLGQTAEVLTIADDRGNLQVRLGLMSVSVTLTDVESLTGEKPKTPPKPTKTFQPPAPDQKEVAKKATILIRTSNNTIDVRGQRVDAAMIAVDRAMNAAHASGILWVIHGKGTGKLREGIHDFLSTHAQVTKVELASNPDGGAGVSIVYLK